MCNYLYYIYDIGLITYNYNYNVNENMRGKWRQYGLKHHLTSTQRTKNFGCAHKTSRKILTVPDETELCVENAVDMCVLMDS